MRAHKAVAGTLTLSLAFALATFGQVHERYEGWCTTLETASLPDLVQFLNTTAPDERNGRCVTWAINKVGKERYEPAAPALARFLDFHRPLTANEKLGVHLRPRGIGDVYPAVDALVLIGVKALPTVLHVIEADSTSTKARENAVFVWMEVYRITEEHPRGVALLKQEELKATVDATKERLKWAVSKALAWCNPPEASACKRAASVGAP